MKKLMILGLVLCLVCAMASPALAESFTGKDGWNVTFTTSEKLESSFDTNSMNDAVSDLQPGDEILFTIQLGNDHTSETRWYMANKVLYSLEDRSLNSATSGGAYTYRLAYVDPQGEETVLFDSDTVGGDTISEAGEGLHAATNALQDFIYLDSINQSERGKITLLVALDGETQGNDYQDTLADLQMDFAVELNSASGGNTRSRGSIVKTGDEMNLTPYYIAMLVSGTILLVWVIASFRDMRRKKEAGTV